MSQVGLITSRRTLQGCMRSVFTTSHHERSETAHDVKSSNNEEGEFRVYKIDGLDATHTERRTKRPPKTPAVPRFRSMPVDQDWTDVWPSAATFKWSVVPFPVRQGYVKNSADNKGVIPSKYANLELMKGPNFLHLTPAHVKKHCAALKKFCTQWPEGLETDERCRRHFPIESVTTSYVFAAPSVRDPRSRIATIKFHLSDLELDYHAKDKFIRLVGDKYNKGTDEVTFESDRCPLKSQNMEYLKFVLTAVYFESWKKESWEDLKTLDDMEKYIWDLNVSKKNCLSILKQIKAVDDVSSSDERWLNYLSVDVSDEEAVCSLPEVADYKKSVEELFCEDENIQTINNYKNSVKKLLNIQGEVS
ncbi:unnamed protein product [Candidula unifasciata]|uniref:Small ribosomal subunit protein mS35 mitochondrial conserved domain-containing protein n=1 Tax=Candidula unifasciata TaxID=100452 RepID=A0A8S3ZE52_9EUPU|nr:unnamed protein product [Candidula unifasciata]